MGLASQVSQIWQGRRQVAKFVSGLAQVNGAYTLFTITGGLVRIHGLFIYCDTALDALAAGTTFVFAINGIAVSAPAVAVTGSVAGDIIVVPLGAAAIVAMGNPYENIPTVIGDTAHFIEGITGPLPTGLIVLTQAGGALGVGEYYSAYCDFTPMEPTAQLV
jgi:hypothetical protein